MALSNNIIGILNLITFLLSIPLIGAGIWLATKLDTECVRFLEWPLILIGIVVLLLSLAGFIGAFWRIAWLLWIYLLVMFIIIVVLLVFTIFAFVVTNKGGKGVAVSGAAYREYRLGDYSQWLQNQVENSNNWRRIKSCIRDANVCRRLVENYSTVTNFYASDLSPVQSGCCKPPTICGFQYVTPTFWANSNNLYSNPDCMKWNNDQSELCYDCNSCKAGLLANVKEGWRKVAVLTIVVLIALIVLYIIGCCAFRNAQTEDLFKRYREGFSSTRYPRRRRRFWNNEY